ncbi:hypothetical protein BpHYR1_049764, partial [Brachionus plicatilis]
MKIDVISLLAIISNLNSEKNNQIFCGGWVTKLEQLKFNNVQIRAIQRWDWDLIYDDLDGSLTDETNNVVVYNNNFTINDPNCKSDSRF